MNTKFEFENLQTKAQMDLKKTECEDYNSGQYQIACSCQISSSIKKEREFLDHLNNCELLKKSLTRQPSVLFKIKAAP
jgi:hypothetical protein